MKLKQKIHLFILALVFVSLGAVTTPAFAAPCPDGYELVQPTSIAQNPYCKNAAGEQKPVGDYANSCGGADTAIIACPQGSGGGTATGQDSGLWGLLILAVQILTAGVGIAAVGGIVYASILYATAEDKAEQTKRAVTIIWNAIIGIVVFGGMYLLINFLIPGGLFT